MIPWLGASHRFPPLSRALAEPNGLLAAGGDLSPERLRAAYGQGIFPWFSDDQPILWWSPDPRMVLYPGELRIPRSLSKTLKKPLFDIRVDTAFRQVMRDCAEPRAGQAGTWITEEMTHAYCELHAQGLAHSVESWRDDQLVGGLYGIALGRAFFGESMFARESDASKTAFVHLVHHLRGQDYGIIDCQMRTPLLASFGAREIPRSQFVAALAELVNYPSPPWPRTLSLSATQHR
ncbi:MAG: leucyl/phenylalanyl-tRNA--protein transferase [Betaproteobacteria bacterium]|nr:leucyl/phenylalanyl-tRNA--protein transferase [Betaproteobacteria bacterium]